jgi:hypothetical protein
MPETDKTGDHVHDFKQPADPDVLLIKSNESVSKLDILGNVEIDCNVRILKMVLSFVLNDCFWVFLNRDLLLKNVCWDQIS